MKKIVTIAALAFVCGMQAQFGVKAGFNFANFRGDAADDFNVLTTWHAGVVYENEITSHFSFQPELLYSVSGAKKDDTEYKLGYFSVPLMLKVYPTGGFNIQAGPQLGMLINESDNFDGLDSETFDFGLAAGLEFFLTNNLFIQARYYSGTKKVSADADLKNTVVSASLGLMF
ncbi:porin family protein [Flavobacterium sp. RHBU_24]|uniref:porin family protein n=1 Tax=Flavobacterium sp. RHBU_24 TaxID=3391185 RepID=UPI003985074A